MNPDILALIDKAKNSLGAARILIRDGYFDFAASRAYYAMFYIAEDDASSVCEWANEFIDQAEDYLIENDDLPIT